MGARSHSVVIKTYERTVRKASMSEIVHNVTAEIMSFLNESNYPSEGSFDHIVYLTDGLQTILPPKFFDTLKKLERKDASEQLDGSDREQGMRNLIRILELDEKRQKLFELAQEHAGLETSPLFALDQSEKNRALDLCAQLRELVSKSQNLSDSHRNRLLKRIASMEVELHKLKGNFDVFLGGMSDVGDALNKLGNDAKPIVDRMREIKQIVRSGSRDYDSLPQPEDTPLLAPPKSSGDNN